MLQNQRGFTFIELLTVVAIIGILAAIAIPQFSAYRAKAYRAEGFVLAHAVRKNGVDFYDHTGRLPQDNAEAGVAAPEQLRGKYVERIAVDKGTIRVEFQPNYRSDPYAPPLVLVPEVNRADPSAPLVWKEPKS